MDHYCKARWCTVKLETKISLRRGLCSYHRNKRKIQAKGLKKFEEQSKIIDNTIGFIHDQMVKSHNKNRKLIVSGVI